MIDLDNGDYGRPVTGDAAGLSFKKNERKKGMLESALKEQLKGYFCWAGGKFLLLIYSYHPATKKQKQNLLELLGDVADCSDHITCSVNEGEALKFYFIKEW